jgi:hypothetical protein
MSCIQYNRQITGNNLYLTEEKKVTFSKIKKIDRNNKIKKVMKKHDSYSMKLEESLDTNLDPQHLLQGPT